MSKFTLVAMSKDANQASCEFYKSFSMEKPQGIPEEFHVPGTYVIRHDHDESNISYRVYHCIDVEGTPIWYRLPSIKICGSEIIADRVSVVSLFGLKEKLSPGNDLRILLEKIDRYFV